uniref:Uncharacterized protein n=1 Tax=Marseillevirus LCMAC101 TaxID=2506602 RepID=A0A481YSS0_9VIRU|nr:MAG: hypothetical protein LCMAC101_04100 [Marseillevirus LCMAC101]
MDYTSLATETVHRKEHEMVWRPVPKTFGTPKKIRIELHKKIKYYQVDTGTKCPVCKGLRESALKDLTQQLNRMSFIFRK